MRVRRHGHPDLLRRWLVHRRLADITDATRQGVTIQFGGGPHPQDWYGTLDAIAAGRLDPLPSVGEVIGLDGVPDALDPARRSDGPPRIVVHPNGDVK